MSAHYRVSGYDGVAWYLLGYKLVRDEDFEWSGIETEDRDFVRAVMVGDDRVFVIDVDDLEQISDEDFCRDCGQIGCGHNVYS
jgi:hypothetical protein